MMKFTDITVRDEAEMRAFYESCGISKSITEAAIRVKRNPQVKEHKKKISPIDREKRKGRGQAGR